MREMPPPADRPATLQVAGVFLLLGAQGFGGLGAVLALLTRDLVTRRGWLRETDVTEALTYTKLLPGSTVVQVVAYLGWKLRGLPGVVAASVAFLLPAFLLMLCLAAGYRYLAPLAGVPAAVMGLTAAVAGLLVVTTATLGKKNVSGAGGVLVALAAFAASVWYEVNPALLVIVAGLIGVWHEARTNRS